MDPIKEAFSKIKDEISSLREDISSLKHSISAINQTTESLKNQTNTIKNQLKEQPQTDQQTHIQTHNPDVQALYTKNSLSSIGNKGVPTDRQTLSQTDQQTDNTSDLHIKDPIREFREANEILSTLDSIKKEIRLKFKGLTKQEMTVFATLYSLDDQESSEITYKTLAKTLTLSESSIRDYINKLLLKGIPINKIKMNNKTVYLSISDDLKGIATLETILQLRDI